MSSLSNEWVEFTDPNDGETWFVNRAAGRVQWQRPPSLRTFIADIYRADQDLDEKDEVGESIQLRGDAAARRWCMIRRPGAHVYYYNESTGESVYELPLGSSAHRAAKQMLAAIAEVERLDRLIEAGGEATTTTTTTKAAAAAAAAAVAGATAKIDEVIEKTSAAHSSVFDISVEEAVEMATEVDAAIFDPHRDAFRALVRHQAPLIMENIYGKEEADAMKKKKEKKKRKRSDAGGGGGGGGGGDDDDDDDDDDVDDDDSESRAIARFRSLLTDKNVKPFESWENALPRIESDPRFFSLPRLGQRRRVFDEFSRAAATSDGGELRRALEQLLDGDRSPIKIDAYTTFGDFCKHMSGIKEYEALDRRVVEAVFRARSEPLRLARQQRKAVARERFQSLLQSLGDLTEKSRWQDVKKRVSNTQEYKELKTKEERTLAFNQFIETLKKEREEAKRRKTTASSSTATGSSNVPMSEDERRRLAVERLESERRAMVRATTAATNRQRHSLLRTTRLDEIRALFVEHVKNVDDCWSDVANRLAHDVRFSTGFSDVLNDDDRRLAFEQRLDELKEAQRRLFRSFLFENDELVDTVDSWHEFMAAVETTTTTAAAALASVTDKVERASLFDAYRREKADRLTKNCKALLDDSWQLISSAIASMENEGHTGDDDDDDEYDGGDEQKEHSNNDDDDENDENEELVERIESVRSVLAADKRWSAMESTPAMTNVREEMFKQSLREAKRRRRRERTGVRLIASHDNELINAPQAYIKGTSSSVTEAEAAKAMKTHQELQHRKELREERERAAQERLLREAITMSNAVDQKSTSSRLRVELPPIIAQHEPIQRYEWPCDEAWRSLMDNRPCVLTNFPLCTYLQRWTMEYMRDNISPDFKMTVKRSSSFEVLFADEKRRATGETAFGGRGSNVRSERRSFRDFYDLLKRVETDAVNGNIYLQESLITEVGASLLSDFKKCNFALAEHVRARCGWASMTGNVLFAGPQGIVTPAHYDEQTNLFAQLCGRKRVYLFSPNEHVHLPTYPLAHSSDRQVQASLYDANEPRFSHTVRQARGLEAIIEPGDVLFIPDLWFHHVESPWEATVSVSWWFKRESFGGIAEHGYIGDMISRDAHLLANVRRNSEKLVFDSFGIDRAAQFFALIDTFADDERWVQRLRPPHLQWLAQMVKVLNVVMPIDSVLPFIVDTVRNRFKYIVDLDPKLYEEAVAALDERGDEAAGGDGDGDDDAGACDSDSGDA